MMKTSKQTATLVTLIAVLAIYLPSMRASLKSSPQESINQGGQRGQGGTSEAQKSPSASPTPQSPLPSETERAARILCFFFDLKGCADIRDSNASRVLMNSESEINGRSARKYRVETLIATIPDPKDSRLVYLFDHSLDAIQRATEAAGYVLDRHWLLWDIQNRMQSRAARESDSTRTASSAQLWGDYRREPSLILFRRAAADERSLFRQAGANERRLLLLFLVGETPTGGIHKIAFRSALDQISMLPPWLTGRSDDPPGRAGLKIRVLGPTFSGSAVSLSIALKKWLDSYDSGGKPRPEVRIISGSATAIDKGEFLARVGNSVTFNSTVPLDEPAKQGFIKYLVETNAVEPRTKADQRPEIAILSESNTAFGQGVARDRQAEDKSPPVLNLTFPLHISHLRREAARMKPSRDDATDGLLAPADDIALPMDEGGEPRTRDVIPLFSPLEPVSIEQVVVSIFSAINREPIRYIGIFTTDVQDRIFLVHELRRHCPNTVIFLFSIDLLYLHSEANLDFQGSLVITPYPLFSLNQLWTYPFNGDKNRLQFSTQNDQGCYNAILALLGRDDLLLEYGAPFDYGQKSAPRRPALWLSIVGRNAIWPVRTLPIEEEPAGSDPYVYSIPAGGSYKKEIFVGYRDHSSLTSALLLLISLICLSPSIIFLLQLAKEKLDEKTLKGRLYLFRERMHAIRLINRPWIGRTFALDHNLHYDLDHCIYLFSCCVSLLIISLANTVVALLPDWIEFKQEFRPEHGFWFHLSAYFIFALTLLALLSILSWLLFSVVRWIRRPNVGSWSRTLAAASLLVSLSMFSLAGLALSQLSMGVWRDDHLATEALFFFLRATDFRSGVSLLLPWIFLGLASSLTFFGALKRLELDEKMHSPKDPRQNETPFDPYLNFITPSFTGLDKLEDRIKELIVGRIFAVPGAFIMVFVILIPYAHRFVTHHIPSIEGRGFDWFFIAAFYFVPLLLGWTFLRFLWLSVALIRFLNRLSWHPLFNTPIDTEEASFQMLPKVNLMSPTPSYTAMSASLTHAQEFFKQLDIAAESERVTSWPNPIQKNIWIRIEEARKNLRQAIQAESEGRWRDTLGPRRETQQAISAASKEIAVWMESHWAELNDESAENKELIKRGRIFMISHVAAFLQYILVHLQNMAGLVSIGFILVLLAAISYPFQPRESLLLFAWISILIVVVVTIFIFIQINRDKVFSLVSGSKPGQLNLSRDLIYRVLIHGVIPIATLLGAQFPETVSNILSWLSFFKDSAQ